MMKDVEQKLADLERMDHATLKATWHKYFDHKPAQYQRDYMIRRIAYHMQAMAYGGLKKVTRNKLHRLAFGEQKGMQDKYHPSPGTRLFRDYKGQRYHVTVLPDGFDYNGRLYPSLTAIAREIVGQPTSGPLFFGLKKASRT